MNLNLLDEVKNIIKTNEDEINKTEKGFNLISILGMENNERYTHSNIIAELLNAKGSHTFGNKFFELFLEQVGISNFDITDYHVITEEYFPNVKCGDEESMRTFLDIVIKERNTGRVILIENKIWAKDQFEQLERYYECHKDKIVKLFYLNVHQYDYTFSLENLERELNEVEENEMQKIKKVYQSISYETIIKNWLANCIVASSEKPYVSKQIEVYYQTILKISNQNIYKKMSEDIKNKITENIENFETASEIANSYYDIKKVIIYEFRKELYSQIQNREIKINDEAILGCVFDDENCNEKLYLGFELKGNWSEELKLDVKNHLQKICEKFEYNSNDNWFFWVDTNNSTLMHSNFKNLSTVEVLSLKNDKQEIIENVKKHFDSILKQIELEFTKEF